MSTKLEELRGIIEKYVRDNPDVVIAAVIRDTKEEDTMNMIWGSYGLDDLARVGGGVLNMDKKLKSMALDQMKDNPLSMIDLLKSMASRPGSNELCGDLTCEACYPPTSDVV